MKAKKYSLKKWIKKFKLPYIRKTKDKSGNDIYIFKNKKDRNKFAKKEVDI